MVARRKDAEVTRMKCFMCKGDLEHARKTYVATLEHCVIVIKDVPAMVCTQCGEAYYTDDVSDRLEQIIDKIRDMVQEVAIVEYDKVA